MRVFLGFGQTKLRQAMRRDPGTKGVGDGLFRIGGGEPGVVGGGIVHHSQQRRPFRHGATVKPGKSRIADGGEDFTGTVGAEIQAEKPVTILRATVCADNGWRDEFILLPFGIALRHGGRGIRGGFAFAMDHGVIGPRHPVPAVVAVHRPVTANHRGDKSAARQPGLQVGDEQRSGGRGNIAAIGNGMDRHRHPGIGNRHGGCDQMGDMGMNPAIRHHPDQMRGAATGLQPVDKAAKLAV